MTARRRYGKGKPGWPREPFSADRRTAEQPTIRAGVAADRTEIQDVKEHNSSWRRTVRPLLATAVLSGGVLLGTATPANAAPTAGFAGGILTVRGDAADNNITAGRNAAGAIRINGGAIAVTGGNPTVANTTRIQVFGLAGNDVLSLDESNGALPVAEIFGGSGNDVLTGGSGA